MSDDDFIYQLNPIHFTPSEILEDVIIDIQTGEKAHINKALVILLDDKEGKYDLGYSQAGMSLPEMLSAIEVLKTVIVRKMGYIKDPSIN